MNPTIKNHKEKIIGFKAFKKDDIGYYTDGLGNGDKIYFEEGKEYSVDGKPELYKNGFHFFRHYCFALDYFEQRNMIAKVESLGEVQEDTEKCVTNKIKILAIEYQEEVNNDSNSGDRNSGDWNSGNGNSGNGNSGNGNSGNGNSGNWNSGNGYLNYFCTDTRFFLFDIECAKKDIEDIDMSWFNLTYKTYKDAWKECPDTVLETIKKLKNFNADKFFKITGIPIKES